MTFIIQHDPEHNQFATMVDGKRATLSYQILPGEKTLDYYSTFVPPELRGRNIGQEIVKFALDYAKEHHYKVIPSCSFIKAFIKRNPGYKRILHP